MRRALLCVGLFAALAVRAQFTGVTAELRLDQDQLMPDEDMQVKVSIINRSGIPIALGQDNHWLNFLITSDDGSIASKLADMPVKGPFTLPSGQIATLNFNPTPYFDFRRPGHYHIYATLHIGQWNQDVSCREAGFFVANGVALPNMANLPIGVPQAPGATNVQPIVHYYSLVKVAYQDELKLYFRLTDDTGKTLRVFPLARLLSFSVPEAQLDRSNNLHVLFQTGAHDFSYFRIDPQGRLLAREIHDYVGSRPVLRMTEDGQIFVHGGIRRFTEADIPSPSASRQ